MLRAFQGAALRDAGSRCAHGWRAVIFYVWDQIDLLTFSWPALSCMSQSTTPRRLQHFADPSLIQGESDRHR
ncbi:MAG: hypothetical protein RL701_4158 [Pseudomonadota bacterium]